MEAAVRSIETLRQEMAALNKQLSDLQQTSANKQQALKRAEADYRNLEEELKAVDAPALDKQIEKLRQEREQLLIEQARLEASGNIKDLRGRLAGWTTLSGLREHASSFCKSGSCRSCFCSNPSIAGFIE